MTYLDGTVTARQREIERRSAYLLETLVGIERSGDAGPMEDFEDAVHELEDILSTQPDGPASPVHPDDDDPVLLALREALGDELEQSEDWRNDEGEEFIPNDPAVEALGVTVCEKLKPLLGASPVLGDEEPERLEEMARRRENFALSDAPSGQRYLAAEDAEFLRKLASQGEERDG
jgi:hypothetical protein